MDSPISPTSDLEKGLSNCTSDYTSKVDLFQEHKQAVLPKASKSWSFWKRNAEPCPQPKIRKLDTKERSYRSLATFLDSDEHFMVYRRFGYLHSRVILRKQDQLRKLEAELEGYDNDDANGPEEMKKLLISRDYDETFDRKQTEGTRTRTQILVEIEETLSKYDEWMFKAQQMVALKRPADRDYQSVERYIREKKPLLDEEHGFIYNKQDLITLRDGRELAFLDNAIERILAKFHCRFLQRLFCTKDDLAKTDDPSLHYYSKSRKELFITILLCLVLLCLLILPVFLLYKLTVTHDLEITYTVSIGVLLVFTLVFSAVLSLFTQAKRHEIFAAAAAYCAVLVVFISNIPGNN